MAESQLDRLERKIQGLKDRALKSQVKLTQRPEGGTLSSGGEMWAYIPKHDYVRDTFDGGTKKTERVYGQRLSEGWVPRAVGAEPALGTTTGRWSCSGNLAENVPKAGVEVETTPTTREEAAQSLKGVMKTAQCRFKVGDVVVANYETRKAGPRTVIRVETRGTDKMGVVYVWKDGQEGWDWESSLELAGFDIALPAGITEESIHMLRVGDFLDYDELRYEILAIDRGQFDIKNLRTKQTIRCNYTSMSWATRWVRKA